jgi:chromosome partitioning protein
VIPRTVRLGEAPSFGKPITAYAPGSYAATVYRQVTDELLARESVPAVSQSAPPTPAAVNTSSATAA